MQVSFLHLGADKGSFFRGRKAGGSVASIIQGIMVEIGGDTIKLSTALSKVDKEIRDTQSRLTEPEQGCCCGDEDSGDMNNQSR